MEKNCDIVVLGGGGSGLVAAARAAELSGGRVIVLEKGKVAGGGMLFASTMRTFGSQWQAERGIPDQSNDFLQKMMDLTQWRLDPALARNAILATGEFFDWYSRYEKPEILARYEARPYVFDIPVNGQPGPQIDIFHNGSGRFIVDTMLRRCEKLGVEVLTEHRAVGAEVKNGRIAAVTAEGPDGPVRIACKACVLAIGSWICNPEIVGKVCPAFLEADVLPSAHQNPNYTGDGLPIAEAAGALIDWDSFCLRLMGPICSLGDRSKLDMLTHTDCAILVDLNAKRFVAEPMAPRIDPFDTGLILLQHPKGRSFFLYSANTLDRIIRESRDNGEKQDFDVFGIPALPDRAEIDGWFREAIDRGSHEVGMADTVEELAAYIGLDPAALRETVDRYNASCAAGADWDFFKDPAGMEPLAEGPFYAIAGKLATDGAFGGVRVDPSMQAYAADGGLVPGLFVTGDFASGRHVVLGGAKRQVLNDMSWALASGYIAGGSAAQALSSL
jgi:fumarate reductase flavoprotein subunit